MVSEEQLQAWENDHIACLGGDWCPVHTLAASHRSLAARLGEAEVLQQVVQRWVAAYQECIAAVDREYPEDEAHEPNAPHWAAAMGRASMALQDAEYALLAAAALAPGEKK